MMQIDIEAIDILWMILCTMWVGIGLKIYQLLTGRK